MSGLTEIKYGLRRPSAAKELGIPVGLLDKLVKQARRALGKAADGGVVFSKVEPWDTETDPAVLLGEICETIRRFVVCEPEVAVAVALWIAFTWLIDRVGVAPLLVITAPEKRCGKSQLLSLVGLLSYRPLPASNISTAAVFRVVEARSPTLLLDEADTFMKENEELRGVINSGHTRQTAFVIRTVGDEHELKRFSTWGAKAIAGIGRLPETTLDRAVVVQLKRKLPSEKTDRLRHTDRGQFEPLCRKLARFVIDNGDAIQAARPDLPEALNDRAQDNWEPLLAIADRAGGRWPTTARAAALKLSGAAQEATTQSTELLFDIRSVFDATGDEKISTAELLRALIGKEESPWATCNAGKPMTARNRPRSQASTRSRQRTCDSATKFRKGSTVRSSRTPLRDTCPWHHPKMTLRRYIFRKAKEMQASPSVAEYGANPLRMGISPLPLQNERCSGTADVAECGGFENLAATRKGSKNNECSGVAEFGPGTGDDKPAEPWGEFL